MFKENSIKKRLRKIQFSKKNLFFIKARVINIMKINLFLNNIERLIGYIP